MSTSISANPSNLPTAGPSIGPRGRGRATKVPRWLIVLITVVVASITLLLVGTQGHVRGREFSPTLFQARNFSFYEIPLLQIQITPIRRSSATPSAATYVRQNGLLESVSADESEPWHLVSLTRGITSTYPADAELLVTQLSIRQAGESYWRKWSVDHPDQAQILWPVIQRLAKRELYVLMPRLFELAAQTATPEDLATQIDDQLRQDYAALIADMRSAGRDDLAKQLYDEALADYPDDPRWLSLSIAPAPPSTDQNP